MNEYVARDKRLDNTANFLLKEGYLFIKNRTEQFKSDLFETYFLGIKVVCMSGEEAARLFYNKELFTRDGVIPKPIQQTLTGVNAIHTFDGEEHLNRKALFLSLVSDDKMTQLLSNLNNKWNRYISKWELSDSIKLYKESRELLFEAACEWTGVPLSAEEIQMRARDMISMVEGFGSAGFRHIRGRIGRNATEEWLRKIIKAVRNGAINCPLDSALHKIAAYKDVNDNFLDVDTAARELINVIRPIVAIAIYIAFSALALHEYPQHILKLKTHEDKALENFVNEVRRFYPLAPFLGAKVKKEFEWNGYKFQIGKLVLLDIYGMGFDERIWDKPREFNPDRFINFNNNKYNYVPQGGSEPAITHRCPGEILTVEIMKNCLNHIVNDITYEVPFQNLNYSLTRIPTYPESGFIMRNVRRLH